MRTPLGTGIFSYEMRHGDPAEIVDAAAELESLGYTAIWVPDIGGDLFAALDRLLGATTTMTVASGVLNIWMHPAADVARWHHALAAADRERILLGLGVSHAPIVGSRWQRPLETMCSYLDELDALGIGPDRRCIGALGPQMVAMAAARSCGAHPYNVVPERTARLRDLVGHGFLAVAQGAVLSDDDSAALGIARRAIDGYSAYPHHVRNWRRQGFDEHDVTTLSDRLVDSVIAHGDEETIWERVAAQRAAGADHVCLRVYTEDGRMPRDLWRRLAPRRADDRDHEMSGR